VVTDPPYLNLDGGIVQDSTHFSVAPAKVKSVSVGDPWGASLDWASEALRVTRYGALVMCSYKSVVPTRQAFPDAKTKGLGVWHYNNPALSYRNVPRFDVEFIWLLEKRPGISWGHLKSLLFEATRLPAGCFASERVLKPGTGEALHPCQKPIALMESLLLQGMETVLDPFAGLGTTGVACVKTGRRFIGIEIDEGYCEIARERIEQAAREPRLL